MTKRNVGRPPKNERASHCCMVRFTDTEFARFLALFEQSGLQNKASFIKARVFNETFRVIKVDRSLLDYYQKLTTLYGQFRSVGVNHNQTVVTLKNNFIEKKAFAMTIGIPNFVRAFIILPSCRIFTASFILIIRIFLSKYSSLQRYGGIQAVAIDGQLQ